MEHVPSISVMAPTPEEQHDDPHDDFSEASALSAEPDDPKDETYGQGSSGKRTRGATKDAGEGVGEASPSRIGELQNGAEIFMTRNEETTVSSLPPFPPKTRGARAKPILNC